MFYPLFTRPPRRSARLAATLLILFVMRMDQRPRDPRTVSQIRSSRGMALVSVLFLLMILSALAAATTTNAQIEMMVVRNTVSSAQAEAAPRPA